MYENVPVEGVFQGWLRRDADENGRIGAAAGAAGDDGPGHGRANDAVKLAYLDQDGLGQIDGLDLRCLTEFKRSSNGAVEVKLTDRVAVLEKLLEQQKAEEDGLGAFLEAMDRPAAPEGMCSQR